MATFNDLAVELQEAIWTLVLPARGIHWIEVEGIPHESAFIRESISMTEWFKFEHVPETDAEAWDIRQDWPGYCERATAKSDKDDDSGAFFRRLFTTVPAVFGRGGDATPAGGLHKLKQQLTGDLADEVAYARRCRQLSTYTQMATLLSVCRLSRLVAQQRIYDERKISWPIHRSLGPHYRPRPLDVWKNQYSDDAKIPGRLSPRGDGDEDEVQQLVPRIHALDLVVLRLHDRHGRPTPLLRQAAWQYGIEASMSYGTIFQCFDGVGIEWHPSFAESRHENLRASNVHAVLRLMDGGHAASFPFWLIDGVPRPDWQRDYPEVVEKIFAERMAHARDQISRHLGAHWPWLSGDEKTATVADHHLGQEWEANGRRYYIVFVVFQKFLPDERRLLRKAGLGYSGPFPGSAELWPEALRDPVRVMQEAMNQSRNLGASGSHSLVLSWEPIS